MASDAMHPWCRGALARTVRWELGWGVDAEWMRGGRVCGGVEAEWMHGGRGVLRDCEVEVGVGRGGGGIAWWLGFGDGL